MKLMTLTDTAEAVLAKRYYQPGEDWAKLCKRVVDAIVPADRQKLREDMFDYMCRGVFVPNSPTLMNAGTALGQLSACFVLPVEDSMEGIFNAVKNAALVHQTGGGTGFSFSRLRHEGAHVGSTNGVASGPISFMEVFDKATDTIKQGGKRRGANMGILRVDHPDIMDFITCKAEEGKLANFNLSVGITDEFMQAVVANESFALRDPKTGKKMSPVDAKLLFDMIVEYAWKNGEPGVVFLDTINRANPAPHWHDIEATNPCGEQPLPPYGSCNLGSINVGHFVKNPYKDIASFNYDAFAECVEACTEFLDCVIDANKYPLPEIEETTKALRPIGLGIMGLHDTLIQLGIPYASKEGRDKAASIMQAMRDEAVITSCELATVGPRSTGNMTPLGAYPEWKKGTHRERRNSTLTTIAPTGTISMIADCASGCEPYFSVVVTKKVLDGQELLLVNKHFEHVAREGNWYTPELMDGIAEHGIVKGNPQIPTKWQEVFATAGEISWQEHVAMQAALQEHCCTAISKTINLPYEATKDEVAEAYHWAWSAGCKGLTIYRDGSRDVQVLNAGTTQPKEENVAPAADSAAESMVLKDLNSTETAYRHAVMWKKSKVYLIVSVDDDERPIEVFAKLPIEAGINGSGSYSETTWQERVGNWDSICRLTSLLLRVGMPLETIIKQLSRSSYSMVDAPGVLARVLKGYLLPDIGELEFSTVEEIAEMGMGAPCPECDAHAYVREGGCATCKACGYSECG